MDNGYLELTMKFNRFIRKEKIIHAQIENRTKGFFDKLFFFAILLLFQLFTTTQNQELGPLPSH